MITLFTKFIPINLLPFVFLALAFTFHLLCVKVINIRRKNELYYDLNKKDFISFQKYFDKYYVTSIWYTFFMVILYIIGIFGIFLFARILFIGYSLNVVLIDNNNISWVNLGFILFTFSSFIVLILFYKTFLDVALFTECIKFHYYFLYNKFYNRIRKYFLLTHLTSFLVDLEIALEYITTTEDVFENDTNYIYFRNAELVKNNLTLWDYLRNIGQKYILLWIIFKIVHNIFKDYSNLLYRVYLLPQTIIVLIGCIELFNETIHYLYYVLPILLFTNIFGQYYMFLRNKDNMFDMYIYRYFYHKPNYYAKIRSCFMDNYDIIALETLVNDETDSLKEEFNRNTFTAYISNYFIKEGTHTMTDINSRYKIRREQVMLIILFIIYYYGTVGVIPLYIILLGMYCLSNKVFYYEKNIPINNRGYHKLFWVILLLEVFLIYILILKAKFTFMDTDILWDYGITIQHTYSMEEKINYFWKYFEHIMKNSILLEEYEYTKNIIAQIHIENVITQKETLKDIKQFVYDLYGAYVYRDLMQWEIIRQCLMEEYVADYNKDYDARVKQKDAIMCCIKNILILTTFSKFFIVYLQAYHTITDSYLREQCAKWIADMIIKLLYR